MVVSDVRDAVKLISDLVKETRSIVEAVEDGRKYLERLDPKVEKKFKKLITQMQVTVEGLAQVTGVLADFPFIVGNRETAERDLMQLRGDLRVRSQMLARLHKNIRKLRGKCGEINKLHESLNSSIENDSTWGALWRLLGKDNQAERNELARSLGTYYSNDQWILLRIEEVLRLSDEVVQEIETTLGSPGPWRVEQVPAAARVLSEYQEAFRDARRDLLILVGEMAETADELGRSR